MSRPKVGAEISPSSPKMSNTELRGTVSPAADEARAANSAASDVLVRITQMAELELAEDQRSQYDLQWHPQERMPPGHMLHGYGRRAINAPGSYEERMVLQEQLMEGKRHTGRAALQAPGDIGQTSSGGQPALLAIGKRPNLPRQMYTEHIAMQYGGDQSGGIEEPAAEPAARVNRKLPSAPSREELKQHVVKMQL
ncbi:hypothetical protein CYMTET_5213 [Cymbomonas tetramitiformis]|uniref:Uncharacterized protein n=1 Tax=Cymbomonas tetramitiformis TaxID=36881 RepID=A0AAE0LJ42_9CHLO|nr:hypothetical protein CYMTET_5213 [Cymbomonas tetramitiformis]